MNQAEIIARLERAHRKAAYELRDCLEEFKEEDPEYRQSQMNRQIILRSALAILAAKFPQEEIDQYEIYSYSETKIMISMQDDFSYLSKKMTKTER